MPLILLELASLLQAGGAAPPSAASANAAAAYCDSLERLGQRNEVQLHDLATCFFRGQGRPRDYVRARQYYAQAIQSGFPRSMCALGNMMIDGLGGARDVAGGLALCRRAADAGEAEAQTDLGTYLLAGEVMPRNVVEARRWLASAAAQGQANAAFLLGQIYWNGDGIAKDNAQAARWWRVSHEGGRADAAYLLAREAFVRLTRGLARPQDADPAVIEEALRWFDLAARTDPTPANRQDASQQGALLRQLQAMAQERHAQ
jgi:TPR repeat protein